MIIQDKQDCIEHPDLGDVVVEYWTMFEGEDCKGQTFISEARTVLDWNKVPSHYYHSIIQILTS